MRHVAIHLSNLLQLFVEDSLSLLLADVTHVFCLFVEDIREDQVPERCCQDPFLGQKRLILFRLFLHHSHQISRISFLSSQGKLFV